ncbi:hypothetical protein TNCV_1733711 [Trichonephila clavipes]|nr:hypothetical protein TNCV_1733711 [Trichonephila clavipes]
MDAAEFLHHEIPPTCARVEPAKAHEQHQTNYATIKQRGRSSSRINDRGFQATGAPPCMPTVPLTGLPYLKKGPEGILIQGSLRPS